MTQHSELLDMLRQQQHISRRQRPYAQRKSKLERHRATIVELHRAGASMGEIQRYLRLMAKPVVQAERSTILRFLQQQER